MEDPILKFARDSWKKFLITLLVILIFSVSWSTKMDDKAEELIDEQLTEAAVTFAAVRSLNGLISVIQSTELSGHFILGGTIGIGEILDPLNDNIERLSWVMLASTTSLGIQKLTNELIAKGWISYILTISGLFYLLLLWLLKEDNSGWKLLSFKLFLSLAVLRYAILLMVLFNHLLYLGFFNDEQKELTKQLESNTKQIEIYQQEKKSLWDMINVKSKFDQLKSYLGFVNEERKELKERIEIYQQEKKSFWNSFWDKINIKNKFDQLKSYLGFFDKKQKELEEQIESNTNQIKSYQQEEKSFWDKIKENADQAFDKIIKLTASFVLQTILLPLLFLWGITRLLKAIFAYSPSSPN